jgi:phospholipase/carboxylesterase
MEARAIFYPNFGIPMKTKTSELSCIEINPLIPTREDHATTISIIWLHGLGADANDFLSLTDDLNLSAKLPIRFVFPNAPMIPITINNGYVMRGWYDIHSFEINQRADKEGIASSVLKINDIIKREEALGISSQRIIIGGFSQGAVMALNIGLRFPRQLGGIIALSGYLPHTEELFAQMSLANSAIPVFLAHGTQDNVVPYSLGEAADNALKNAGLPVDWHSYRMAHSVCADEIEDIKGWLQKRFP